MHSVIDYSKFERLCLSSEDEYEEEPSTESPVGPESCSCRLSCPRCRAMEEAYAYGPTTSACASQRTMPGFAAYTNKPVHEPHAGIGGQHQRKKNSAGFDFGKAIQGTPHKRPTPKMVSPLAQPYGISQTLDQYASKSSPCSSSAALHTRRSEAPAGDLRGSAATSQYAPVSTTAKVTAATSVPAPRVQAPDPAIIHGSRLGPPSESAVQQSSADVQSDFGITPPPTLSSPGSNAAFNPAGAKPPVGPHCNHPLQGNATSAIASHVTDADRRHSKPRAMDPTMQADMVMRQLIEEEEREKQRNSSKKKKKKKSKGKSTERMSGLSLGEEALESAEQHWGDPESEGGRSSHANDTRIIARVDDAATLHDILVPPSVEPPTSNSFALLADIDEEVLHEAPPDPGLQKRKCAQPLTGNIERPPETSTYHGGSRHEDVPAFTEQGTVLQSASPGSNDYTGSLYSAQHPTAPEASCSRSPHADLRMADPLHLLSHDAADHVSVGQIRPLAGRVMFPAYNKARLGSQSPSQHPHFQSSIPHVPEPAQNANSTVHLTQGMKQSQPGLHYPHNNALPFKWLQEGGAHTHACALTGSKYSAGHLPLPWQVQNDLSEKHGMSSNADQHRQFATMQMHMIAQQHRQAAATPYNPNYTRMLHPHHVHQGDRLVAENEAHVHTGQYCKGSFEEGPPDWQHGALKEWPGAPSAVASTAQQQQPTARHHRHHAFSQQYNYLKMQMHMNQPQNLNTSIASNAAAVHLTANLRPAGSAPRSYQQLYAERMAANSDPAHAHSVDSGPPGLRPPAPLFNSTPLQQGIAAAERYRAELEEDEHLCVVCMDNPREILFVPCGHLVACIACCEQVLKKSNLCPICRDPVQQTVRVAENT